MTGNVKYSQLLHLGDGASASKRTKKPCMSRSRILAIIVVTILATILILLSCFKSGYFGESVCTIDKGERPNNLLFGNKSRSRFAHSHMKRRLPQCILIGARKSGTRALLTYLNMHPDIVTRGKEAHFFDDDDLYRETLESYRKKMPLSYEGQITIEKTPAYFTEADVPERVYRMNNSVKLLLLLRDPVERSLSDYLQIAEAKRAKNKYMGTFEELVMDKNGRINKSYKGVSRSVYHKHLARWLEFFKLQQIHIIDSKELVTSPYKVTKRVEKFLGLEHKIMPSNFYFNKTKGFYCIQDDDVQKCLADSKGRKHPEIDEVVRRKLKRFFRPHNYKLYRMIGRTFDWDDED